MLMTEAFVVLFSLLVGVVDQHAVTADDELGDAAKYFTGPLEVVATHDEFQWIEGPLYSEVGNYLLFSDVKWVDSNNHTCGMTWKYNVATEELSKFLPCSGLIGPGDDPTNLADLIEAGSNGLTWNLKSDGSGDLADGEELLICQHGKKRIVKININDVNVVDGTIDDDKVQIIVDSYNGQPLNSPNDMYIDKGTGMMYFTDPPFGLQLFSEADPIAGAFARTTQDAIGVYSIDLMMNMLRVEPTRVLEFSGTPRPDSEDGPWSTPNGVVVPSPGVFVNPITDFTNPRILITNTNTDETIELQSPYRIEGINAETLPPLNDGLSYWKNDEEVIFAACPGGVCIHNATLDSQFELLGLLRIDDLVSNTAVGGDYLWITANTRLLRIPLDTLSSSMGNVSGGQDSISEGSVTSGSGSEDEDRSSSSTRIHFNRAVALMTMLSMVLKLIVNFLLK